MKLRQIVLCNQSRVVISHNRLAKVAHALQVQVERDLGPIWGVRAHVMALGSGDAVPRNAWPIKLVDSPAGGGYGVHLDHDSKPYAQVKPTTDWSVTASHELVEMLVDPFGHKFISAPDINPASDGHRVMYLVEVGDPCETFGYSIGDVEVSDFVLPAYYHSRSTGTEVDFLGRLAGPLDVPPGGYLSWLDPVDNRWQQKTPEGEFVRARAKADATANPREDRDRHLSEDRHDQHDVSRVRAMTFAVRMLKDAPAPRSSRGAPPPSVPGAM